ALDGGGVASLDLTETQLMLADVASGQGWLAAWHARLTRHLHDLAAEAPSVQPEVVAANASKLSIRGAEQAVRRAKALGAAPALENALAAGTVSNEHADAFARAVGRMPEAQRFELLAQQERLTEIAERSTPEDFARALAREVRRLDPTDGVDRLTRMKRD